MASSATKYPILSATVLVAGVSSALFFTLPLELFVGAFLLLLVASAITYFIYSGWETSAANEWLLIIQNGQMIKAGIGLKCFRTFNQTAVRFASTIQRIEFKAQQVTKEMIGLEVSGFAVWGVNREGEGPFKCYKYMQGGSPSDNVKTICESIVRTQIANTGMQDVIRNRVQLRQDMKKELQKQLTGWGVWLETVEITEVKISSQQLFNDLQADFRNKIHLDAEQIRQKTSQELAQVRSEQDLAMTLKRTENETKRLEFSKQQQLEREKDNQNFFTESKNIEREKSKLEQQLNLKKIEKDRTIEGLKLEQKTELEGLNKNYHITTEKAKFELENSMSQKNLKKYLIDTTSMIYQSLNLRSVTVTNNVASDDGLKNLAGSAALIAQQQQIIQQTQ